MIEIIPNWHPIFVHFTVALVTMAAIFFLIAKIRGGEDPQTAGAVAGRWALVAGALITVATVAAGFYAYNTVAHDEPAHLAMTDHRNWAVPTALAILALAVWSWWGARRARPVSWIFVMLLLLTAGALAVVGYKGAELVYRHGLGVMRLPAAEGAGHHHGTSAPHEHGPDAAGGEDEGHMHNHDAAGQRAGGSGIGTASAPHSHPDGESADHRHDLEGEEGGHPHER